MTQTNQPPANPARFSERHMPMMESILGEACAYYTVERGISSREDGTMPPFTAMCAFICYSLEGYRAASLAHRAEIMGDIPKYTDIAPTVQISEVVVERSVL